MKTITVRNATMPRVTYASVESPERLALKALRERWIEGKKCDDCFTGPDCAKHRTLFWDALRTACELVKEEEDDDSAE